MITSKLNQHFIICLGCYCIGISLSNMILIKTMVSLLKKVKILSKILYGNKILNKIINKQMTMINNKLKTSPMLTKSTIKKSNIKNKLRKILSKENLLINLKVIISAHFLFKISPFNKFLSNYFILKTHICKHICKALKLYWKNLHKLKKHNYFWKLKNLKSIISKNINNQKVL